MASCRPIHARLCVFSPLPVTSLEQALLPLLRENSKHRKQLPDLLVHVPADLRWQERTGGLVRVRTTLGGDDPIRTNYNARQVALVHQRVQLSQAAPEHPDSLAGKAVLGTCLSCTQQVVTGSVKP